MKKQENNGCLHKLIESQVDRFPNKKAIVIGPNYLTYRQLDSEANKLANYLLSLSQKDNNLIGVYTDRSLETVIGILGILKSGSAYIPLDPKYPKERIEFLLKDSKLKVLITQKKYTNSLPEIVFKNNVKIIYLDSSEFEKSEKEKIKDNKHICLNDLACVVYTSGTTGQPKGVMISHKNICNYIKSLSKKLGITNQDIYLHTASIAFSSSNRQLMVPLVHGSTIIMATQEEKFNPLLMFKVIKSQKVTIIDLVPSHMRSCINLLKGLKTDEQSFLLNNDLRLILSASEALLSNIIQEWRNLFKQNITYINMYGLSETCGIVSIYKIPVFNNNGVKVIPIGSAISGMDIYILDENMNPVEKGEKGFLYISGSHITSGYLNQPSLTREIIIKNSFHSKSLRKKSVTLFKSGDICRYNPNGYIEYIGRSDHQIKLHGIRIDPKEIELTINEHPKIQESVVIAKEFENKKYLVAYLVKTEKSKLDPTKVRKTISKKLPTYMVPTHFVLLKALPLTPNGKVNRINLPDFNPNLINRGKTNLAHPRNYYEKELLKIWSEILKITEIGIFDDYFELGGNSLLGFQMIVKIYNKFNINFSASLLFEYPTIASLAEYLQNNSNDEKGIFIKREQGKI
ncbi:MAG: non-ribosomal peptide synthetase [Bacteroidetes bacterium]|nr:non-ribosomal peptide synthetase [Bacteroidota bacterium]